MSGVAPTPEDFSNFANSLGLDPDSACFTPAEHKLMIVSAINRLNDEHLGHCRTQTPMGTSELAFRVMETGRTVQEAIDLLEVFSRRLCPSRRLSQVAGDDHLLLEFELEGVSPDRAAIAEITVMVWYASSLSAFAGRYIPIRAMFSRSAAYCEAFGRNEDLDCDIAAAPRSALQIDRASLSLPRKGADAPDIVGDAVRWAIFADKLRPIMAQKQLPLLTAERLLQQSKASALRRNVDVRQQRRLIRDETRYNARELENCAKLTEALLLLSTTDRRMADISESLGFSDERAFHRFFQKMAGVTPRRYRTQFQDAAVARGRDPFSAAIAAAEPLRNRLASAPEA